MDASYSRRNAGLRRFPYPYKSMLAICSDLDETPDADVYFGISRFLNSRQNTLLGQGLGLEVGNTLYFDMPDGQFAYWNTDDRSRSLIHTLVRSGHIDCFHSFGDLASTRAHAQRALDALDRNDCKIKCWVDHATAPTNLGTDIMRGSGDDYSSRAYHSDLTYQYGVRYVWCGRVTSIIGQGRRPSLCGLFNSRHIMSSMRTIAVEGTKVAIGSAPGRKYSMHSRNRVFRAIQLRDGRGVLEFIRCNPHWGGVSRGETASGVAEVLTDKFFERLIKSRGACILYTHLGKVPKGKEILPGAAVTAFRDLARRYDSGDILVASTRRLLDFSVAKAYVSAELSNSDSQRCLRIGTSRLAECGLAPVLEGITVYVDSTIGLKVYVDAREVRDVQRNPPDETGRPSISFPWRRLDFPDI